MSEKNPTDTRPDASEAASVSQRIDSLREKAEGELGDELLEDVAGGHTDSTVTHTSTTHTNSPDPVRLPGGGVDEFAPQS